MVCIFHSFMKTLACVHVEYCILIVVCDVAINVFCMLYCVVCYIFLYGCFAYPNTFLVVLLREVWIINVLLYSNLLWIAIAICSWCASYILFLLTQSKITSTYIIVQGWDQGWNWVSITDPDDLLTRIWLSLIKVEECTEINILGTTS